MKLPNGYGSISKLSGKRRKPYMIREGKSGNQKPIGYCETREEALQILAKYNSEPEVGMKEICFKNNWEIIALEVDKDHLHILLEYDTVESISNIVKKLKQESTYNLWLDYEQELKHHFWKKKIFWSDGYFASSMGEASLDTIKHYIENQG